MKRLVVLVLAILSFSSCHKKKTYCICYVNLIEVDRKETASAEECEKRQQANRKALKNDEVICVLQED